MSNEGSNVYELIMLVCLAVQANTCEIRRPPYQEPMSMMYCMLQGQVMAMQWLDEHPAWQLRSWKCEVPKA